MLDMPNLMPEMPLLALVDFYIVIPSRISKLMLYIEVHWPGAYGFDNTQKASLFCVHTAFPVFVYYYF